MIEILRRAFIAFFVFIPLQAPTSFGQNADRIGIACVGDSITEGNANPDHLVNSWPMILGRLLEAKAPGHYEARNFGRSGATLLRKGRRPYWDQDVLALGLEFRPELVIINLGTNDAVDANWLKHGAEFEADYRGLIQTYLDLDSKPRVILSNLTPHYAWYPRADEFARNKPAVEAIIRKLAAEFELSVINFQGATADKPKLFPDALHPNTAGNELMAKVAFEAILGKPGPDDPSLRWKAVAGEAHPLVKSGQAEDVSIGSWSQESEFVEGDGAKNVIRANVALGAGDFHIRARLRMIGQQNSAAGFALGPNFFGFEGARGTVFRNGPQLLGQRLLHPADHLWKRDAWIEFEVVRNGDQVWFVVDGFTVEMATIPGEIASLSFDPMRSRMHVAEWSVVGNVRQRRRAESNLIAVAGSEPGLVQARAFDIPVVDLDADEGRHVVVDREPGQYLGHVSTELLEDGKTILAVYPKGHGRGPIVYKRSTDGGKTWSERLPTPENWATSREVPTIHRVIDPVTEKKRLILWSGLYPARLAHSEDDGQTWSALEPVGDWGGIVVMGFVERLLDGRYLAMFHDDGRFFREKGGRQNPSVFTLYQTISADGGLTWGEPSTVWSGSDIHLCEPGCIRSPDGKILAVPLRENSRTRNSYAIFSKDEGASWSAPRELPASLTGDRHTLAYANDGRVFACFRDTAHESPTKGDWVGWVGTWEDLYQGRPGQYRIRFKDNKNRWDTTYPGVEVLPDGTFVVTTYGHWDEGEQPYILSVRFTLDELDARAAELLREEK